VEIRRAELRDAPELAELMGDLGYPTTAEKMVVRLSAVAAHSDYHTLVAEEAGRVVGMVALRLGFYVETDGQFVTMQALVVGKEWQSKGIGTALVGAAEEWAKARGAKAVVLSSRTSREQAHRFYRHLGYESTGLRFIKSL